ncbi:hypothetical protein, partial [Nocardia carnea]|uniref:hypothetical protein n=1 Tax=Nocardia carnea TaxID=37328 RepID=UPI001C3F35C8
MRRRRLPARWGLWARIPGRRCLRPRAVRLPLRTGTTRVLRGRGALPIGRVRWPLGGSILLDR